MDAVTRQLETQKLSTPEISRTKSPLHRSSTDFLHFNPIPNVPTPNNNNIEELNRRPFPPMRSFTSPRTPSRQHNFNPSN